ncbi:MAG: hypothetical protein ACHQ4J_06500 [Candidatus Binatia bacterium]
MGTIRVGATPGSRLEAGASILAAARTTDTRLIKDRLAAFERAQRAYTDAQQKVDALEVELTAAQRGLSECDAAQDAAVEVLARALVGDGQPRTKPFEAFGAPSPAAILRLPVVDKAKVLAALVTAVQCTKTVSKATLQVARDVDKAVRAVEQALAPIDKLTATLREARRTRDAAGADWDAALATLKRGARAASDDGAPQLYAILFDRPTRTNGKNGKRQPTPAPTPTPAPVVEGAKSA